jgi:hypothetical protein
MFEIFQYFSPVEWRSYYQFVWEWIGVHCHGGDCGTPGKLLNAVARFFN